MKLPYYIAHTRMLLTKACRQTANEKNAKLQLETTLKTFRELRAKQNLEHVFGLIQESR